MTPIDRRRLLTALGAGLMTARANPAFASDDFDSRLALAERDGSVAGLHALLVARSGNILFEHYEEGEDEALGRPLGRVAYGPDVLHDLRSVSKSIVSLLYGIALADGKVPPPEAKLYAQFPEYPDLAAQPGRDRITVAHVLSMTMGTEWDELTVPYGPDLRNSEIAMEAAPDRYRFILERRIVSEPGVKWIYNGGATALLGHLIARGTGRPLPDFARSALFDPLGFGPTEWAKGRDGEPRAASGLRLRPRDLLKIGQLVLARGKWQDRQIVPIAWLKEVLTPKVTIEGRGPYGYQWYLGELPAGTPPRMAPWVGGIGWGGQRLFVMPSLDLVVAVNAGNYGRPGMEQGRITNALMTNVVLPSLT